MVLRIGRLSTRRSIERQGEVFNIAAVVASKVLPIPMQIKMGLENIQKGFRKLSQSVGQDQRLRVEDRGHKLAYITEDCPMCAGKLAGEAICWLWTGSLKEATQWLTGKEFEVVQVECRAMGDPACVWEIGKTPKE